jgi:hypothetical protein
MSGHETRDVCQGTPPCPRCVFVQTITNVDGLRIDTETVRKCVHQSCTKPTGEVTVTTTEDGECIAVTRTDDEGRILSVLWERECVHQVCNVPEGVLVGGNHLASVLIDWLGPDFAYTFPPTADHGDVRAKMGGNAYEVWCCWAAIMRARNEFVAGKKS